MEKQTTIKQPISIEGIGLHTGNTSIITFCPAEANHGYSFVRTDLDERVEIPALVDYVVDLSRGTTIGKDGVKVHTVEHVLAALAGLQIDNCVIEISANEPPVFDGSSAQYVEVLKEAGIKELDAEREYFELKESIRYTNEKKHVEIVALPTDDYRITVMVDYFNPALGSQHTGLFNMKSEFESEFSSARTFCFLTEVEILFKEGLIKGGNLDRALVIVDKETDTKELESLKTMFNLDKTPEVGTSGFLNNTELRFKNEPARHKLLDMIGDLALIGVPIKAQILAARPGHASNFEFAKMIREQYLKQKKNDKYNPKKNKDVVYDINQLMGVLPHRYPFLLVDRIIDVDVEENKIIGYKNVTINEPFFQGHFPGNPIMPGVLILEAFAQTGGLLMFHTKPENRKKLAVYMGVDKAKFRQPVLPGDQLVMEVKLVRNRSSIYMFKGSATVNGTLVAEAEFTTALVDKE